MRRDPTIATRQYTCAGCGARFPHQWPGTRPHAFCSHACANRHKPRRPPRHTCRTCGARVARPTTDRCATCIRAEPGIGPAWNADAVAYLRARYPHEGAGPVAAALGKRVAHVRTKANRLGLTLTPAATRRIVHGAAQAHMRRDNPMRRPETVAKVEAWRAGNPDAAAAVHAKLIAGRARLDRMKPSTLEARLRAYLDAEGATYEASAIIKPAFIVDIRIGRLIIQADGDYWHGHPRFAPLTPRQQRQQARDAAQDAYLTACGYTVVRIWESDMSAERVRAVLREHP